MNLGTAIAVCVLWAALALIMWTHGKNFGPLGVAVFLAVGARAPAVLARIRP